MNRIITYLALGIMSITLLIALNAAQRRSAAAELAMSETAKSAVAEAAGELENLTLSLEKLLVTTSARQTAKLLSSLTLSSERAQLCLAALPDTQGQQSTILAYLSRLSRLCQTALADLAEGDGFHEDARENFTAMLDGLRMLQAELLLASGEMFRSGTSAVQLPPTALTAPPTAMELVSYKALPSQEIGSGEAMQIAKAFVGTDRVLSVSPAPNTSGALPAYGVTIQTPDVQLNLEITRRGGKVLLMAPETAAFPMVRTPEQCGAAALAFLKQRGFAQMEIPYYQVYDGLCVLTCVYTQSGVLVWPDRVLVQVRMDTAEVVGIEARSYWKNHIPRKLQTPLLEESEARRSISGAAEIGLSRLCLLPYEGQERLCWQFNLAMEDETYISYIDALTGQELQLEKVMQLEFGQVAA